MNECKSFFVEKYNLRLCFSFWTKSIHSFSKIFQNVCNQGKTLEEIIGTQWKHCNKVDAIVLTQFIYNGSYNYFPPWQFYLCMGEENRNLCWLFCLPNIQFLLHFFLVVGKNFRLLMQSCCFFFVFFSPDLFMKISNFSKNVHTIFTKFCTVILHPKGPLRVQRHQNRMAGMWET